MSDYDDGFNDGFNDGGRIAVKKHRDNPEYCAGFDIGDYMRIYRPVYDDSYFLGSNDHSLDT